MVGVLKCHGISVCAGVTWYGLAKPVIVFNRLSGFAGIAVVQALQSCGLDRTAGKR
jgi:hypothetical protein